MPACCSGQPAVAALAAAANDSESARAAANLRHGAHFVTRAGSGFVFSMRVYQGIARKKTK